MKFRKALHKLRKLDRRYVFAVVFALAGIGVLLTSLAAVPTVSFEAEDAAGSNSVSIPLDAGASNGSYLRFGDGGTTSPPPGGRPGASNTGPLTPNSLTPMTASQVVSQIKSGTRLFQGVRIAGHVVIPTGVTGTVTFRNFVVDGSSGSCNVRNKSGVSVSVPGMSCYGIQNCYNTSGCMTLIAEDGEIKNVRSTGILAANYTARRLEVHEGGGDAFKLLGSNVLIERSWGYNLGKELDPSQFANPHADFVQSQSPGSNLVIRYNYCNFEITPLNGTPYHANACYIGDSSRAAVTIDMYGNWLFGGNYTVNCYDISTVKVHDNVFSRDYRFGPKSSCPGQWTNNKYEDGSPA